MKRKAPNKLPAEFVIQPRIVVSRKTGERLLRQARTAKPTPALRELMSDAD